MPNIDIPEEASIWCSGLLECLSYMVTAECPMW